jgi:nucleoside phosphorylase
MSEPVDFLIITALDDEGDAVKKLVGNLEAGDSYHIGTLKRVPSGGPYRVAISVMARMGGSAAAGETSDILAKVRPRYCLMVGIAAGFPESGVELGDLLVPHFIVPYELAKIRESDPGSENGGEIKAQEEHPEEKQLEFEHRGDPLQVSLSLWHAANTLANDPDARWIDNITIGRPERPDEETKVHCGSGTKLGSGDKIVASALAESRKWLLGSYKKQAIGLEMESYGAMEACRQKDIPFLMVKASQDPATSGKDKPKEKDLWRPYACEAAAAFALELISRFNVANDDLFRQKIGETLVLLDQIEKGMPSPAFTYTVSIADNYDHLRRGVFSKQQCSPSILLPNDFQPQVILHGGGGTGKTRVLLNLLRPILDSGFCPILFHFERLDASHGENPDLDKIIELTTSPRCTKAELERLSESSKLLSTLDGLNELDENSRIKLLRFLLQLHEKGRCFIVSTERLISFEPELAFTHAMIDPLDKSRVTRLYDKKYGHGTYETLHPHVQELYRKPFFISLVLRSRIEHGNQTPSEIFSDFLKRDVELTTDEVQVLASLTFEHCDTNISFNARAFREEIDPKILQRLVENAIFRDDGDFEHRLWKDFFVSYFLSQNPPVWNAASFDKVTSLAAAIEPLVFTFEQIASPESKDAFLKSVYDWNYAAAAECLTQLGHSVPEASQPSLEVRWALLSALGERMFDRVPRTRNKARTTLNQQKGKIAEDILKISEISTLRDFISKKAGGSWFGEWKKLFSIKDGPMPDEAAAKVSSPDSLIGWAATNLARRCKLTSRQIDHFIGLLKDSSAENQTNRWRVVHILGTEPGPQSVKLLGVALRSDPYHWVRYGSARALIEIAAESKTFREEIVNDLTQFVDGLDGSQPAEEERILNEILDVAAISSDAEWKSSVFQLLSSIVNRQIDPKKQQALRCKLTQFEPILNSI